MRTFAPQLVATDTFTAKHQAGVKRTLPVPISATHGDGALLQRKSNCACGGGCPSCQAHPEQLDAREHAPTPGAGGGQGALPLEDPGQASPLQTPPVATTYPGCTAAQSTAMETARTTALTKSNAAGTAMAALKGGTGTTAQQAALTAHFGTLTSTQFDTATSRYTTISGRLGNAALFACGAAPAQAYCGPPQNWCAGTPCPTTTGISYMCSSSFGTNCVEPNLWSILLHESGRAAGCCPPDVQSTDSGYPPAAPACLTNVFCFSGFARAI